MSMTETTAVTTTETSSGLFAEAVGGIATIVLAILALSGVSPEYLLAIATIVFGAALLIEGTSMAANFMHIVSASPGVESAQSAVNGLSAVFMGGITGIILGVLALLGIVPNILISAAIIVFGSAMILNSSAMVSLNTIKTRLSGARESTVGVIGSIGAGSAGAQVLAGVAAIVLGILALAGAGGAAGGAGAAAAGAGASAGGAAGSAGSAGVVLDLIALLVIGAAILMTGNGMNNAVLSMFRLPQPGYGSR